MKFNLTPHIGTETIKLGMSRDEIRSILGEPNHTTEKSTFEYGDFSLPVPAKDGFFQNELQVTYDDNNHSDYFEFVGRNAQNIEVAVEGIDVFNLPARVLLTKITEVTGAQYDKMDSEIPFTFTYKDLDLAFWRQAIPEVDEESEEVPENDEGKYFWVVGIGIKGYYA